MELRTWPKTISLNCVNEGLLMDNEENEATEA